MATSLREKRPSFNWQDPLLLDEEFARKKKWCAKAPAPMPRTSCCRG